MVKSQEPTQYPWNKLKAGEGFFIPSLNPERTIREGRKAAFQYNPRMRIEEKVGMKDGLYGVLFIRLNEVV
jgi:hypothetical protein